MGARFRMLEAWAFVSCFACGDMGSGRGDGIAGGGAPLAPASAPASGAAPTSPAAPGASEVPGASAAPGAAEAPGAIPLAAGAGVGATPGGTDARAEGAGGASDAGASGGAPGAGAPGVVAPGAPLTIWIAGDSTVANGNTPCPRGWGGAFAPHFSDAVRVVNSAAGGRSIHTWLYQVQTVMGADGECLLDRDESGAPVLQPRWQAMLDGMQPGDYLFVQFGINDGDRTCDRHVGIAAFEAALGMMARAAKERGAQPIFLTPVSMIACDGETARGSRGEFVPATLRAGEASDVPVIDLHARSVELFQGLDFCPVPGGDVSADTDGPVGDFFCDDHTHFSNAGAAAIADLVSATLAEEQLPLAAYLR